MVICLPSIVMSPFFVILAEAGRLQDEIVIVFLSLSFSPTVTPLFHADSDYTSPPQSFRPHRHRPLASVYLMQRRSDPRKLGGLHLNLI
jgi:hypothetical protein